MIEDDFKNAQKRADTMLAMAYKKISFFPQDSEQKLESYKKDIQKAKNSLQSSSHGVLKKFNNTGHKHAIH